MSHPVVVVGDALLDRDVEGRVERLCPDAPVPVVDAVADWARPGGAALAALLTATDGRPVVLVAALGDDEAGGEVAALLRGAGVEVVDLGLAGPTPEKTRVLAGGRSLLRVDRGSPPGPVGGCTDEARAALASAAAVVVADYGRGVAAEPSVRAALGGLHARQPVVWDPHPRGPAPVPGARLATPNGREAALFAGDVAGDGLSGHAARARALLQRWQSAAVAVTLGEEGAVLATTDVPAMVVPARGVEVGDPCGAGDRFSSAAAGLLADGALPSEAVVGAVEASSSFVARGGASAMRFPSSPAATHSGAVAARTALSPVVGSRDPFAVVAQVRDRGGTVVATGGCFDLLHAGHVSMLQAARSLGDCLVVCLNSDRSVRRLKGPGRPLVAQEDRVAVLQALACVDAVAVFDEDTPLALLDELRPDLFAKGADYSLADLPEAQLLTAWGGEAVVLPYLPGRSTSRLVDEVATAGSR